METCFYDHNNILFKKRLFIVKKHVFFKKNKYTEKTKYFNQKPNFLLLLLLFIQIYCKKHT